MKYQTLAVLLSPRQDHHQASRAKMALPFDSPGNLERRIAAQMAADQSDDSSFGVSRKAASMASMSFSTGDESYMRAGLEPNRRSRNVKAAEEVAASTSISSAQAGVLSPRSTNLPNVARTTLVDALAASGKGDYNDDNTNRSSIASTSKSSMDGKSDTRVRSPPLTSTPHPAQAFRSRRTSFHKDADAHRSRNDSRHADTETLTLSFMSAKDQSRQKPAPADQQSARSQNLRFSDLPSGRSEGQENLENDDGVSNGQSVSDPLRESDLPETSSYFRSKVLGERFEASMAGDESLSEAIIQRRPTKVQQDLGSDKASSMKAETTSPTILSEEDISIVAKDEEEGPLKQIELRTVDTPKPTRMSEMEHMKAYVLSSVKATNPLRQAQLKHMTPRARGGRHTFIHNNSSIVASALSKRYTINTNDEEDSRDVEHVSVAPSEVSSTNDLTLPTKFAMRANTSLPGVEEVEMGSAGNARVDPKRLQHLLHKINGQLEAEVAELRSDKEELQVQYERALLDCERLRKQAELRQRSTTPPTEPSADAILVKRLQGDIAELRRSNEILRSSVDQAEKSRLSQLEADLQAERDARNEDEEMYRIEVQALTDDRERLKRQLEDDRAAARAEISRIKATTAQQQNQGNAAGDVSSTMQADIEYYEQVIYELRQTNAQMSDAFGEREALREDYEALDNEYQQTKSDLEQMRDELNEAKDKIADLEIALSERENEIIKLDFKLSNQSSSSDLRKAKEQIVMLETTLAMTREAAAKEAQKVIDSSITSLGNVRHGATPVHPSIAALRKPIDTPRSPPANELSSASWMHSLETFGEAAIKRDLSGVRHDLEDAKREVDERIAKLGQQGLFKQLVDAQETIKQLEDELYEMRAENKHGPSLARTGSNKDRSAQYDVSSERSILARSTASVSHNKSVIQGVKGELESLKRAWAKDVKDFQAEREALEEEKEGVRRTQRELNAKRAETKERARKQQADTLASLSKARRLVSELERGMNEDAANFQSYRGLDDDAHRELDTLAFDLQRTKARMEEIDREFHSKRSTFERLEHEIQERSHIDESLAMNVQGLHLDTARFSHEMQRLREERQALLQEREKLFARRAESHQQRLNAQEELRMAREALLAHQRQLDEQVETIESLHDHLSHQTKALDGVQADRDRLYDQRREILVDVAQLEADLRRVRDESKRFGADLDGLQKIRGIRSVAERQQQEQESRPNVHAENVEMHIIQLAKEQAKREQRSTEKHQADCRGLLLQIRYEKARYMRESDLRQDLVHQKQYLLGIVGGLRMSEKATAKFVADLRLSRQHNSNSPSTPLQKFRAASYAVMAVCRARRMADNWRCTVEIKRALRRAHAEAKGIHNAAAAAATRDARSSLPPLHA
jgi:chromosome segregation ATPase